MEHQPGANADKNDSDVLNRMKGEQSFEVALHQRVQHAQQCGDHAYGEHETTPPPRAATQQSSVRRRSPYTPILIITPDISAETAGAAG